MARRLFVDQGICIGCGLCMKMVPEVFRLNESGVSEVHHHDGASEAKIQEAVDGCPVSCIHWH